PRASAAPAFQPFEELVDAALDHRGRLLVALASLREAVELQRLAERDGARREVPDAPVLRAVDGDRDDRHVLLQGDHRRSGLRDARSPAALARAFDEQADDLAAPGGLAHPADGVAIRLATPDGDRAVQPQVPPDH